MLKKIFYGTLYLLLLVMIFTYMLITPKDTSYSSLLTETSYTGVSVIGFLLIIPTFIFTILALSIDKYTIVFCRDLFSMFVGIFVFTTSIIGLFKMMDALYIPVIVAVCAIVLLVFSFGSILKALRKEQTESKEENRA